MHDFFDGFEDRGAIWATETAHPLPRAPFPKYKESFSKMAKKPASESMDHAEIEPTWSQKARVHETFRQ